MKVLLYNDLDKPKNQKQFQKVVEALQSANFGAIDVKKVTPTHYYRAKLNDKDRLLFCFSKYNNETYILILEIILNHEYEKSRFLRGHEIEEQKFTPLLDAKKVPDNEVIKVNYVNENLKNPNFHILDKVISFDNEQSDIFYLRPPVIIIGSAGSGKTALTLEKIKALSGNILYVTLSSFLVENASQLYYSYNYENENQEIDFLSFKELLETFKIIEGKEIDYQTFHYWFQKHRNTVSIKDSHKLFEEFKGVITGINTDSPFLSKEEYLQLGVKQSVFLGKEREEVYSLFEKYIQYLEENKYYDLNLLSYQFLSLAEKKYDFIIVDEVQDFTNIQLFFVLSLLNNPTQFLLCGDSNQIVHPNFFSWSRVKSMFYKQEKIDNEIRILHTNYRNSPEVTELSNRLLKIKNARFGSIDKESTYLVNSISQKKGEVVFYEDLPKIKQDLNQKTKTSTKFAVLVMRNEDKSAARQFFQTPLIFSVQEAKGLEYENVILWNFVSKNDKEFREIIEGVSKEDVENEDIKFSRAKDKTDKSLDVYKFYVNALYVAMTRAVQNLYVIEATKKHEILRLLNLIETKQSVNLQNQASSLEDWKKEARRLELQGKKEQAEDIRKNILKNVPIPWIPLTYQNYAEMKTQALNPEFFNKKTKDKVYEFAINHGEYDVVEALSKLKYRPAEKVMAEIWQDYEHFRLTLDEERQETFELPKELFNEYVFLLETQRVKKPVFEAKMKQEKEEFIRRNYANYRADAIKLITQNIAKYGLDFRDEFNNTPLHSAITFQSKQILQYVLEGGADIALADSLGRNALQIGMANCLENEDYLKKFFINYYTKLQTDSIKIKVNNHLVKVGNHSMEYFLLNYLLACYKKIHTSFNVYDNKGLKMSTFMEYIEKMPSSILPEYRRKKQYVNSILAKNEINRDDKYNKRLFLRTEKGAYILNPDLEILVGEEWVNMYKIWNINLSELVGDGTKLLQIRKKWYMYVLPKRNNVVNRGRGYWGRNDD
jgi:ankyrin repeat protein